MTVLVQSICEYIAVPEIDFKNLARKAAIKALQIAVSMIGHAAMIMIAALLSTLWVASTSLEIIGHILTNLQ